MGPTAARQLDVTPPSATLGADRESVSHALVADLHLPDPRIFWTDLLLSAVIGWGAFAVAVAAPPLSLVMFAAALVSACALYRGVSFTHELSHLRRRAIPGFETAWNMIFGVPLLLPSFTYIGVHQSHHSLSTYGTKADPEYLPFARSSRLNLIVFGLHSTLILPIALALRFLLLSPLGLVWPRFHRWLETYASSFAMNTAYRREVSPEMARRMRRWETAIVAAWSAAVVLMVAGVLPARTFLVWLGVLTTISFLNTARVLGAHEYESDGTAQGREWQLEDSIDTPGGPWTELWAPVGLRYHALHHYFPGIPYHNLGKAYQRIMNAVERHAHYLESTSPSLPHSLSALYGKTRRSSIVDRR